MAISKIKTVSIEDNAVTAPKIVAGAVVADIADDSITGGKFANDIAISTTGEITTTGAFTSNGIDDNANATAIVIDANEKILINTSGAVTSAVGSINDGDGVLGTDSQLQLHGSKPVIDIFSYSTTDSTHGGINFMKSASNTVGTAAKVSESDIVGSVQFGGYDGTDYASIAGKIDFQMGGNGINQDDTAGEIVFYTTPDGSGGSGTTERMRIESDGDVKVQNGNLVIGTSGKGIDFSATAGPPTTGASGTSELLDDYEEGTMSLVMGGHTNIGTAAANIQANNSYSGGQAHYIKIGTLCYIQAYFYDQVTSVQSAGELIIQGLPFAAAGNGGSFVTQSYNLTLPSGSVNGTQVAIFSAAGASQLNGLVLRNNATWDAALGSAIPTSTAIYFRISGTYRTQ